MTESMDSLSETTWDVILSGTGINQSLLALSVVKSPVRKAALF